MARRQRDINLPAPYLKRLWLDPARVSDREAYPFCLPFLADDFELGFERAITIIVGENGTGKSTLLEGIAALAGYDGAGGGKGYRTVDHSGALEVRAANYRRRCARAGCRRSPRAGSFAPRASFLWRAISIRLLGRLGRSDRASSHIPTVRAFCASSRSAVSARASSSSTSRSRHCRRLARSNS